MQSWFQMMNLKCTAGWLKNPHTRMPSNEAVCRHMEKCSHHEFTIKKRAGFTYIFNKPTQSIYANADGIVFRSDVRKHLLFWIKILQFMFI